MVVLNVPAKVIQKALSSEVMADYGADLSGSAMDMLW